MIDVFNQIYTRLKELLKQYNNKIETASVYTNTPKKMPFVSVEEIGNSVNSQYEDCCNIENCANISLEVNCYAQGDDKMSVAKAMLIVADDYLASIGFIRTSKTNIQENNGTTFRIVARYEGVVSKDNVVYRR